MYCTAQKNRWLFSQTLMHFCTPILQHPTNCIDRQTTHQKIKQKSVVVLSPTVDAKTEDFCFCYTTIFYCAKIYYLYKSVFTLDLPILTFLESLTLLPLHNLRELFSLFVDSTYTVSSMKINR